MDGIFTNTTKEMEPELKFIWLCTYIEIWCPVRFYNFLKMYKNPQFINC